MLNYLFVTAALAMVLGLAFEALRPVEETFVFHIVISTLRALLLWVIPSVALATLFYGAYWLATEGRGL
ncbi:hypothetical protein NK553_28610 [Pseudomonas sp. ZM23]|uniref:Uncharacterized protein n=1 Tax=Pseudomonas triclosanedens TaxID=2961893 RepID=A0ABY7A356_9PSED|nr:hypothetical protein [Pseudomonas triclosanedens]MCP8467916.1 hypothetical protein [Pseudomonas triclosanedens]MCP8473892.1 hypothetical protein [Pseudomonas triclosanedens]MCP8479890.1 hypothetical protein [Pseudomonas triclosanedens]WAI51307.1 hypothetical protein OU419_08655 [Pseudomonas triclosanedens]